MSRLDFHFCFPLGEYKYYDMDATVEASLHMVKQEGIVV